MSPTGRNHEKAKGLLQAILGSWETRTGVGMEPCGNATFQSPDPEEPGLEPDDSYIVQTDAGPRFFAIEVEDSVELGTKRWARYRTGITDEGLDTTEVWVFSFDELERYVDGEVDARPLRIYHRRLDYQENTPHFTSGVFPKLPIDAVTTAMATAVSTPGATRLLACQLFEQGLPAPEVAVGVSEPDVDLDDLDP